MNANANGRDEGKHPAAMELARAPSVRQVDLARPTLPVAVFAMPAVMTMAAEAVLDKRFRIR